MNELLSMLKEFPRMASSFILRYYEKNDFDIKDLEKLKPYMTADIFSSIRGIPLSLILEYKYMFNKDKFIKHADDIELLTDKQYAKTLGLNDFDLRTIALNNVNFDITEDFSNTYIKEPWYPFLVMVSNDVSFETEMPKINITSLFSAHSVQELISDKVHVSYLDRMGKYYETTGSDQFIDDEDDEEDFDAEMVLFVNGKKVDDVKNIDINNISDVVESIFSSMASEDDCVMVSGESESIISKFKEMFNKTTSAKKTPSIFENYKTDIISFSEDTIDKTITINDDSDFM